MTEKEKLAKRMQEIMRELDKLRVEYTEVSVKYWKLYLTINQD